jgi:hypothetical protein
MIQLTRERTAQAIPAAFRGPGRLTTERALLQRRSTGQDPDSAVWKKAKKQLRKESGGKCAYCEGKASHVAHGDVEHFRPKTVYWWLAYCWDNWAYSCQICNQTYKGSSFPFTGAQLAAPGLPIPATPQDIDGFVGKLGPDPLDPQAVTAFTTLLKAEKAGLPDPYGATPNPETLFTWFADETIKEVEIRPRGSGAKAKAAFKAVDEFLGLNRQELKSWRWDRYEEADAFCAVLKEVPPVSAQLQATVTKQLQKMMSVQGEFAAMVRFLVRERNGFAI